MTDDVIAFVRVRGDSGQIFLVDPGSGEARALTDPDFDAHDPSWCPDGSQLVALGRGPGGSFIPQLHVIDVATGKTERITNDGAPKLRPAWSPDGLEIVFEMSIGETGYHLFTVHPDGRGLRRVTGPPMNQPLPPPPPTPLRPWVRVSTSLPQSEEMPAWSPDGSEIAFARSARVPPNGGSDRRRPGHHIWVVGREGGEERRLTEGAVHDLEPAYAPDGSTLAFTRFTDDEFIDTPHGSFSAVRVHTVATDGPGFRVVTHEPAHYARPSWSPDCRHLVCSRSRAGSPHLYIVNADGSGGRVLTDPKEGGDYDPAWRHDPRRLGPARRSSAP